MLYSLYRAGHGIANALPLKSVYGLACAIADTHRHISRTDREAVRENLIHITGSHDERELHKISKAIFRNFAKYLVDFFRFEKIDNAYIKDLVSVEGLEHIDEGLARGKGVIALSAHMGNWELGGLVLSHLRKPIYAVALTHEDKMVNDFFTKQRSIGKLKPVEIGISLRSCFKVLKKNGLLALLGDRDFSGNGCRVPFFGKESLIPKGPAVFSQRTGACIVPCFMLREDANRFRFIFEKPIFPSGDGSEEGIRGLVCHYASIIEKYVRRYPDQWYAFTRMWK